ncbi:MAG: hypothetical protein V4662_26990 [Verrucomicrobiota bacterium]
MKTFLLAFSLVLGALFSIHAEIPVQVSSETHNAETAALIASFKQLINEHEDLRITHDTSELRVVISLTAVSSGNDVVLGGMLEVRPPGGPLGVVARSSIVLATVGESRAMLRHLHHKLLIEDNLVNKLLFMRKHPVASGDLNEVCRLMMVAKAASDRGQI